MVKLHIFSIRHSKRGYYTDQPAYGSKISDPYPC